MSENADFKRWYDKDAIVAKCVEMLQDLQDSFKRRTATFLMDEIINKPPYDTMLPDDVYALANSELRRRRWYDYDMVARIFVELLKFSTDDIKKDIAVQAVIFMEDLSAKEDHAFKNDMTSDDEDLIPEDDFDNPFKIPMQDSKIKTIFVNPDINGWQRF